MKREISLEEISDGKLYGSGDMVKVGCDDCRGCSACCRGMGSSIVLDPYDVFRLETGLGLSFEASPRSVPVPPAPIDPSHTYNRCSTRLSSPDTAP